MQEILKLIAVKLDLQFDLSDTSFFVSRDAISPEELSGMSRWRETIFSWMLKNSARQSDFFKIPLGGLMEFVTKIRI
jgi:KUP system potassium uptake protein